MDRFDRERAFVEAQRTSPRMDLDEANALATKALSVAHWRELCPSLGIDVDPVRVAIEQHPLDDQVRGRLVSQLKKKGYLSSEPFLSAPTVEGMRRGIETLAAHGWPPVFAYVFDDFWRVLRAPSVIQLMTEALGHGYVQSPRVWAFSIVPEEGASGWPPHVDGGANTHTPDRLTVWIPLSDATLDNGCMYLIPKDRVPPHIADEFANTMTSIDARAWRSMLQSSRAMPARAGSVLAWDFQMIHWSSIVSAALDGDTAAPRVSLAVELLGPDVSLTPSEQPTIDARSLPPFRARLLAIARGLLSYQRFEPEMLRHERLARKLVEILELEPSPPGS